MFKVVIPFYEGQTHINRLVSSIPTTIPIIIVDDVSSQPLINKFTKNVTVFRLEEKGYFAGAVNKGIELAGDSHVVVLNQDTYFEDDRWITFINKHQDKYAMIGERIKGVREDFPHGYIHGTFMFMNRQAIQQVGTLNQQVYPLWGNTAEWQLRVCRKGWQVLPLTDIPGFVHKRQANEKYGSSIKKLLQSEPKMQKNLIKTPPEISVIIPVHGEKYAKFLPDTIASLIGGMSYIGEQPGQTFQSFEVIIVEDSPLPETTKIIKDLVGDGWLGIRHLQINRRVKDKQGKYIGKPVALNSGIAKARGKYITVLDADDMMAPTRLERLWEAAQGNPGKVICDDSWIVTNGDFLRKIKMLPYDFDNIVYQNSMHIGIFYPKKAWEDAGGYPTSMRYGREDWAFNVGLGLVGWCGYNLREHLYWYRRDSQNRTLENSSQVWRNHFVTSIQQAFPSFYLEGVKPMGCCGKKTVNGAKAANKGQAFAKTGKNSASKFPGSGGMTWLIYNGSMVSDFTVWGTKSGSAYRITPGKPFLAANEDLRSKTANQYGLLEIQKHGRDEYNIFKSPLTVTADADEVKQEPAFSGLDSTSAFGDGERIKIKSTTVEESLEVAKEATKKLEEVQLVQELVTGVESKLEEWHRILKTIGTLDNFLVNGEYNTSLLTALKEIEVANKNRAGALSRLDKALANETD
jgi:glycosyltransferase involved in cell wall biosynthesis